MAKAGVSLTKGLIYGLMFGVLFAFIGLGLEAVIQALAATLWPYPVGVIPLVLFVFGLFGSVAISFSDYTNEAEK